MIINFSECCACDKEGVCSLTDKYSEQVQEMLKIIDVDLPNVFRLNFSCECFKEDVEWLKNI